MAVCGSTCSASQPIIGPPMACPPISTMMYRLMTRPRMAMLELIWTSWLAAVRNIRHQNPASTIAAPNHTMDGASEARHSISPYIPAPSITERSRSSRRRAEVMAPASAPRATSAFSRP